MKLDRYAVELSKRTGLKLVRFCTRYDQFYRPGKSMLVREGTSYIVQKGVLDKYSISFLNSISYTENCYHCQYANIMRVSDITLGDSWGSNLDIQEQRKGISLILNQTQKGKELLEQSELELMDVELNRAIEHNHQLRHPSIKPNTREASHNQWTRIRS